MVEGVFLFFIINIVIIIIAIYNVDEMQIVAMPQLHNNMSNCHEKHKGYKNFVSILIHGGLTLKVFNLRKEEK
jgi:hypothetical protein